MSAVPINHVESDEAVPLPKSIRIGSFDYRVETLSQADSDHFSVAGDFNHYYLRIRVLEGHRSQRQAEIILHEALHGIYKSQNIPDDAKEEEVVTNVAIGLVQLIRDNPDLMAFVNDAIKQGAA